MLLKKICNYRGCNELIDLGNKYCEKHSNTKRDYSSNRQNFRQRGYDTRYDKVSAIHKKEHPLCETCSKVKRVTPVEITHHIIPTQLCKAIGREDLIIDMNNMTSRCRQCHGKEERNDQLWFEFAKTDNMQGTAKEIIARFERWRDKYGYNRNI
jgi:hypothetical protein